MWRANRWYSYLVLSMLVGCGSSHGEKAAGQSGSSSGGSGSGSSGVGSGSSGSGSGSSGAGSSSSGVGSSSGGGVVTGGQDGGNASSSGVTISPKSVVLQPSATQAFTCAIAGSPNGSCTWQVAETGGGTITSTGNYAAPATLGTFHVVAANASDSSQTDTATVVVRVPTAAGCGSLGPVGQWEGITPPNIQLPGPSSCPYGTAGFNLDPQTPSTIYLGTCSWGIYKSTDCGGTWTHVDTGMLSNWMDHSRQWFMIVDPIDPQVLYTNAGYNTVDGNHSGAFKSTNGGLDWKEIWPPPDGSLAKIVTNNFVAQMNIDPTNHLHLLVGFHQVCAAPYTSICFGETKDGGQTWTLHNADSRWQASESQTPYLLNDQTWLFADHDSTSGLWLTTNAGQSWTLAASMAAGHWPGQLYHAQSGWYIGGDNGILHSPDGMNWSPIPNTGSLVTGFVGDGTTMWAAKYGSNSPWVTGGTNPYITSAETDGTTWTPVTWTTPAGFKFTQGGSMRYDPVNHIVYSSNGSQGLWRVVVR